MKNNKVLFLDLDGTLLNNKGQISPESISYLRFLKREGFRIVLCSGRPDRSIIPFRSELGLTEPFIAYNGAKVFLSPNNFISKTIDPRELENLLKAFAPSIESIHVETSTALFKDHLDPYISKFFPDMSMPTKPLSSLPTDAYIVVMKIKEEDEERFAKTCGQTKSIEYRHWSYSPYCEIFPKGISKGSALPYIIDEMKVSRENLIGFGDSDNDMEMLTLCAQSYLMKNSKSKNMIGRFPMTSKNNDEDGVIDQLKQILGF